MLVISSSSNRGVRKAPGMEPDRSHPSDKVIRRPPVATQRERRACLICGTSASRRGGGRSGGRRWRLKGRDELASSVGPARAGGWSGDHERRERGRGGGKEFVVRQRRSGDGRGGLHPFRASLPSAIRAIKETGFCGLGRFALSPAHSDLKWLPITHM
ncbi:hypothetical protein B296_00000563 [Ensete ventricosum]|uniref:Uncharacterized protein n=1 Tax=Ensete ventricosum TaxID=4639 RepID=A0A427A7B4_ENSVE|nr:hypothetical protein B296_00000563 [Ensete ventricosum]